jgi:dTDP-4-dehydrorhamnose reductase
VIATDLPDFDLTDRKLVDRQIHLIHPDVIVNAAAYTAVNRAESEPTLAFNVNRDGPAYLASACADLNVPLIHMSTDYVFDGTQKAPYLETDPISPLGIYGQSKAEGEKEIRKILPYHVIIRTAWLYGIHGHNFVKTMLRLGGEQEHVRVVADQYGCPTYAADLAGAILSIVARIRESNTLQWGTYHFCGGGQTSWHGFAEAIFSIAKKYTPIQVRTVEAITTTEFPTPAKRPAHSALNCSKIKAIFKIQIKPWKESLACMIRQLLSEHF